jgi:hypothetical protein
MNTEQNSVINWFDRKGRGNPYNVLPRLEMLEEEGYISNGIRYDRSYVVDFFKRAIANLHPSSLGVLMEIMEEAMSEVAIDEAYASMIQPSLKINP